MRFGLGSGILWGLDTVILGMALALAPLTGAAGSAVVGSFLHDALCALWLLAYMAARGRLEDTLRALRTRSGVVVILGALLGGPIGMTGYVVAIDNLGAAYTAVVSAFYPAFGALLSHLLLGERMSKGQVVALAAALLGVMAMGLVSAGDNTVANPVLGLLGAAATVVGWGSEAVLCAWGMREGDVDNETALQIRETASATAYAVVVLPLFGASGLAIESIPTIAAGLAALSALSGTASYLLYYQGISAIGAARAMALNVSYSAWAVGFSFVLQGIVPTSATLICCAVVLAGTVLTACDWKELFGTKDHS